MSTLSHSNATQQLLETAFPFHFGVDALGVVTVVGKSLEKAQSSFQSGKRLADLVTFERPGIEVDVNTIRSRMGTLAVISLDVSGMRMRGQFCELDNELFFLGAPWQVTVDSLDELGLCVSDFALHDISIDRLIGRDVSERQEFTELLRHQSLHDPLTELPNRTMFDQKLTSALVREPHCAVLFLDLDDFKSINDSMGHTMGDEVLHIVSERLRFATKDSFDTIARLGGDEFGVLLVGIQSPAQAEAAARRLIERICEPITLANGRELILTGSIGIATSFDSRNPEVLYRSADLAMYRSKVDRKNSVTVFDHSMYEEFAYRNQLRHELMAGIHKGEFIPFFQPIINFNSGKIHGWEALARWNHPERGLLTPFHFVDAAEETGLVIELGVEILEQACLAMNQFVRLSKSVHVNLSPVQIQRGDIVSEVKRILTDTNLSSDDLTLEITETTLFGDIQHAEEVLHEIKSLGVRIALDDFGVGYSSLRYLERFPIDVLKLDRSFVSQVDDPAGRGYRLIEPTIQLGRALDLQIVAEGIETPEQARKMRDFGCHYAQGYFYGRPMPLSEAEALLNC